MERVVEEGSTACDVQCSKRTLKVPKLYNFQVILDTNINYRYLKKQVMYFSKRLAGISLNDFICINVGVNLDILRFYKLFSY